LRQNIALIWSRIIQLPGSKTPPLQHLNEFVEEEHTAIVGHPLVIPSDIHIWRRSAHFHRYFTKGEVRVEAQKGSHNPMKIGEKQRILCLFTPDSGIGDIRSLLGFLPTHLLRQYDGSYMSSLYSVFL
jgi:hypothetical protein